jgi:hypothetical protein
MRRPSPEGIVPYEVTCLCGRSLRGRRQQVHQIIACPSCGRQRFILPSSPWLAPAVVMQPTRLNIRCFLVAVVLGGFLAMGLCLVLLRPYLRRSTASADGSTSTRDARAQLEAGQQELRNGNIFLALSELNVALEQSARNPDALDRPQLEHLQQLHRQTDLLTHLLDHPLEEIVLQATQHRSEEEWTAKLSHYRGRTVIFDDVLRRDGQGRPALGGYAVQVAGVEARVALEDLTLLRRLPLEPPIRCLFGARLASCRREDGGIWVFRFDPDSAVLFTDESAASAGYPLPLDKELLGVLERQKKWLR